MGANIDSEQVKHQTEQSPQQHGQYGLSCQFLLLKSSYHGIQSRVDQRFERLFVSHRHHSITTPSTTPHRPIASNTQHQPGIMTSGRQHFR
jgi:hypothetical protein